MPNRLVFLVTEDWYFLSHRLPMARAARAAGFEVHVATRVADGRSRIEAEGFHLHALDWQRRDGSPLRLAAAMMQMRRLLRELAPVLLHNIALKPAIVGGAAATGLPGLAIINSINGLGSGYLAAGWSGELQRAGLGQGLRLLLDRQRTATITQNPEDFATLRALGVRDGRLRLIAGSGVDIQRFTPQPEPPPPPITVSYVGRLLVDKGLRTLVAAHRLLVERGIAIKLQLAGLPDPENQSSIPVAEVEAWAREPGIRWLGQVTDIAQLWAQSHLAVLPSRREGLPMSLLEASACGRPMIATDVPGCRDVIEDGVSGLLVPVDQPEPLADAIMRLAADPEMRHRMGAAARTRAETEFSSQLIAAQITALYREMAAQAVAT